MSKDTTRGVHWLWRTYALVARLEAIRMLLAFSCFKDFKLYQMDVKSDFLNDFIEDEVYVKQSLGFENRAYSDYVFKLSKAFYGLKQAPRVWYDILKSFFLIDGNCLYGIALTYIFKYLNVNLKNEEALAL